MGAGHGSYIGSHGGKGGADEGGCTKGAKGKDCGSQPGSRWQSSGCSVTTTSVEAPFMWNPATYSMSRTA